MMSTASHRWCLLLLAVLATPTFAQVTATDGDWAETQVELRDTPEAALMARTGDIDNLGFGFPAGFDPFSGSRTPSHSFPFTPEDDDPEGTDRIMVVSSHGVEPQPCGGDGYTSSTSRPENDPRAISLSYDLSGLAVSGAQLQLFVDDFQAGRWCATYRVFLDGQRAPFLESVVNAIDQTGPVGELITLTVPGTYLSLLEDGELSILFDDPTTGAADGYAIDFVKLLVNPVGAGQSGTVAGVVTDDATGTPLADVLVTVNNTLSVETDADGAYSLTTAAGLATVRTTLAGYGSQTKTVQVVAGETGTLNFALVSPAPEVASVSPSDGAVDVAVSSVVDVTFTQAMDAASLATAFLLSGPDGDVDGAIETTLTTLRFTPSAPLAMGTPYTATVSAAATNETGVALADDVGWAFTTVGGTDAEVDGAAREPLRFAVTPMPLRDRGQLRVSLVRPEAVSVAVYDLLGRDVHAVDAVALSAGDHVLPLDASGLPSGVYVVVLTAGAESASRTVSVLRL